MGFILKAIVVSLIKTLTDMTLFEYLSSISSTWKLAVLIILFCAWPLSAFMIFHYQPDVFFRLDLLKLSLLASAMTAPFLIVNAGLTLLLLSPANKELKVQRSGYDAVASTSMLAGAVTSMVLAVGAVMAYAGSIEKYTVITMGILEGLYVIVVIVSAIRERP